MQKRLDDFHDNKGYDHNLAKQLKVAQDELMKKPSMGEVQLLHQRIAELEKQSPESYRRCLRSTKEQLTNLVNRSEISADPNIRNIAQDLVDILQDLQGIEADVHGLGYFSDVSEASTIGQSEATSRLVRELKEEVKRMKRAVCIHNKFMKCLLELKIRLLIF